MRPSADQVGKSFSWPGREGDEEASDSSVTDGLGVSLELLMGRNTGMGPMAEQWNNGAVLSGPNLTQRGPLYNIRPTIPGSAFSCRVGAPSIAMLHVNEQCMTCMPFEQLGLEDAQLCLLSTEYFPTWQIMCCAESLLSGSQGLKK